MPRTPMNPNVQHQRRIGDLPPGTDLGRRLQPRPALTVLANRTGAPPPPALQTQVIDLSVARTTAKPLSLPLRGNALVVNASTFPTDTAQIRLNGAGGWLTVSASWRFAGLEFDMIEIANVAQTGSSLELIYLTDPNSRVWFGFR